MPDGNCRLRYCNLVQRCSLPPLHVLLQGLEIDGFVVAVAKPIKAILALVAAATIAAQSRRGCLLLAAGSSGTRDSSCGRGRYRWRRGDFDPSFYYARSC